MPTSLVLQIPYVLDCVLRRHYNHKKIKSVLDIGIGWGKYGLLMREYLTPYDIMSIKEDWELQLDGVEVYPEYINAYHHSIYTNIWIKDIRNFCDSPEIKGRTWDLVLLIDVVEHMPKKEGLEVIRLLEKHSRWILVTTPTKFELQPAKRFHGLEQHVCVWEKDDFSPFHCDKIIWTNSFLLAVIKGVLWEPKEHTTTLFLSR